MKVKSLPRNDNTVGLTRRRSNQIGGRFMTPLQQHVADWKDCTRCSLHETRKRVCIVRGTIPCDVLFIGEAPGVSEDVLGRPFVGPAGQLLDRIVKRAMPKKWVDDSDGSAAIAEVEDGPPEKLTWAFTNLVGCIPIGDEGTKTAEPDDESIKACTPRVQDIVKIANPKLIVCVGKLATGWINTPMRRDTIKLHRPIPIVNIVHPAAILRAPTVQQGLMVQRCVLTISEAVENL